MRRFVFTSLFVVLLGMMPAPTHALDPDALTTEQTAMIASKCREAQRSLQRIQYIDPVARVSRGNATSKIVSLMSALNSRSASNTFNIPSLVVATNDVQSLREQFATEYTAYEISLRDLIAINCVKDPHAFYAKLVETRLQRSALGNTVKEIEKKLDAYQQSIPLLRAAIKERS